jgi:hypothetical protein
VSLFAVGIGSQIALQARRAEQRWFQARAVAETAKSLTWEYMMRSTPLESRESVEPREKPSGSSDASVQEAEARLVRILKDLRGEFKKAFRIDWEGISVESEISDEMRAVRLSSLEERKSFYQKHRVDDQIAWYDKRARANRTKSRTFAGTAIAIEITGLVIVVYAFTSEFVPAEGVLALIATLVAGVVGWSQSRRYAELVEPYAYVSEALGEIRKHLGETNDEMVFRELVEDSERAISREHQMWQIIRGVTPRKHLASLRK